MKHHPIGSGKRKSVNLSIDTGVVEAARAAGLNLSRVTEEALHHAIRQEHGRRWIEENLDAVQAFSDWYDREGDPIAHLRVR